MGKDQHSGEVLLTSTMPVSVLYDDRCDRRERWAAARHPGASVQPTCCTLDALFWLGLHDAVAAVELTAWQEWCDWLDELVGLTDWCRCCNVPRPTTAAR